MKITSLLPLLFCASSILASGSEINCDAPPLDPENYKVPMGMSYPVSDFTIPPDLDKLTLSQRNALALAAAKSLSIKEFIDQSIFAHIKKPLAPDNPAEAACRKRWATNMAAADALRTLAERRQITEAAVLPYLIEGLCHPDQILVGRKCLDALVYLTRQESGQNSCWNAPGKELEIWRWWCEWYEENKDKHPVYDGHFESQVHTRLTNILTRIHDQVGRSYPALQFMPTDARWTYLEPLFNIVYDTTVFANRVASSKEHDVWLHVYAAFETPPIGTNICRWTPQPIEAPSNWKPFASELLKINIPHTDVILGVRVATRDKGLVDALSKCLKPMAPHLSAPIDTGEVPADSKE